jgi:putative PIN family toxin of toxin-antitoxin system
VPALRVVLDTNVLLSGLAYPASLPGRILAAWRHGAIEVLLSWHILEELRRVLPRLSHRHGLADAEIADLVDALAIQAEIIEPLPTADSDLRDATDQPVLGSLLAALVTSRADYLVTRDKDLLALSGRYPIIDPAAFWARHGGPPPVSQ